MRLLARTITGNKQAKWLKHAKSIKIVKKRRGKYNETLQNNADKYYKECLKRNKMPFIEDLQLILGVDDDTIVTWAKDIKHKKEFSATYRRIIYCIVLF